MTTQLYNLPYLKERRIQLRKNMTEAELILWAVLKDKKLKGYKFRRQHSIGNYIADFYCSAIDLIIELDGHPHCTREGMEMDLERDTHLALMGKKVLRFENKEVINNLTDVLKKIKEEFGENT